MTSPVNRFMIQLMKKLLAVVFACMVLVLSSCDGQMPDRPGSHGQIPDNPGSEGHLPDRPSSDGQPVEMDINQFNQLYHMDNAATAGISVIRSNMMLQSVKPEMRADYESQVDAIREEYWAIINSLDKQHDEGTLSDMDYYEDLRQAELEQNEKLMRLELEWQSKGVWDDIAGVFRIANSSNRPRTIRLAIWAGNYYQGTGIAYFSQPIELQPESDDIYTVTFNMGGKYAEGYLSGIEIAE